MQAGISLYACNNLDLPTPNKVDLPTTDQNSGHLGCFPNSQPKALHRGAQRQQWPLLPLSLMTR